MKRVEDEVREFIQKAFRAQVALRPVEDDTPLFSGGIIDSFGVLELIAFLEETFKIEVDTAQYDLTDFDTIGKIGALVVGLRRKPPEG
jgi:acyl carrier protein